MRLGPFELKLFKSPIKSDTEIGESGTTIFGGYISDEDYVAKLTGTSALTIYDKMRKSDGVVKASLLACELPIRAASWFVEPASDDEKDKEVAEFVSQCLFENMTITWDDFLRQALLMLPFGFSVFEKVFTAVLFEGKQMIGWRKFAPRGQSSILKWQTEDGNDGITQTPPSGGSVSIPIEKLVVFTNQKEGDNWLGISVLRNAYRPWSFKKHIEKINSIAFERQGLGIPYARLPKGYTDKERTKAEKILKNLRANEQAFIIEPDGWEIEFKDMKAKTVKDPDSTIRRYNREILISVLAQFLDLGAGNTGSRALSADQSTTFHNNLTAIARQVKDVINKYAIKQLVDLNYTVAKYPSLGFSKIGRIDYEGIAKALSGLIQHGAVKTDDKLEAWIRNMMDLPDMPEKEEEEQKPTEEPKEKEIEEASEFRGSEFVGWRPLTFAEKKVNLGDIQRKMNMAENELRRILKELLSKVSGDLIRQTQVVLETVNSTERRKRLNNMTVPKQKEYRQAVLKTTRESFEYGKTVSAHEMRKTPPTTPTESIQNMSRSADNLTGVMANDMMKASKLALLLALQQKLVPTKTLKNVTRAVKREASSIFFNVPAIAVNGAINQGRRATFTVYEKDIYALQRSEVLDEMTCFPAKTKIKTINGNKNIENIKIGDKVFTHKGVEKVSMIGQRKYKGQMVELKIGRKKITTTAEHPFWVKSKGWVIAKDLRIGDKFVNFRKNKLLCNFIRFYHQLWNSNNIDIVFNKIRVLASIPFRIFVPIRAVNLQCNPIICKKEVNRISANSFFLNVFNFKFIQNFSNFLFNRSLTPIFSGAGYRAKSAEFMNCGGSSKRFTALNTNRKERRTTADFRAKLNIFSTCYKYLSTAKASLIKSFSCPALETTKVISVGIGNRHLKFLFAIRAYLGNMFQLISASHTTIYARSCFRRIYQFATSFAFNIFSSKFSHQLNYSTISQVKQAIVYNLSVANDKTYFANGILVHNCNYCMSIDKRVFKKTDPFVHNDGIHSNCRGIWVEIMETEKEKPPRDGIPKALRDNFETINVFKPPKNPIVKKSSPAADFLKQKADEITEADEIIKAEEGA